MTQTTWQPAAAGCHQRVKCLRRVLMGRVNRPVTSSNCGNLLKPTETKRMAKAMRGRGNSSGYGNTSVGCYNGKSAAKSASLRGQLPCSYPVRKRMQLND